LKADLKKWI